MKTSPDPLNPLQKEATKHAEYVIDLVKKLADGKRPGILATVDECCLEPNMDAPQICRYLPLARN